MTTEAPTTAVDRFAALEASCREERSNASGLNYVEQRIPVTEAEAAAFMSAIDAGVIHVDAAGWCSAPGMRPSTGYSFTIFHTLSKAKRQFTISREWLTHAAIAASLHLDYGYPLHDIALDVGPFDALVFSPTNQPLIALEAKKHPRELAAMLREFEALQIEGATLEPGVPLSNAAKKFRGLVAFRPSFFLAVAPGESRAFEVRYPADRSASTATLTPIDELPRASSVA